MRIAIALSLAAGAVLLAPAMVSAAPLALSDHAAVTHKLGNTGVEQVARRRVKTRRYVRQRCDDWMDRPYWRPYQYQYWQYYYPYGGPLF
ncbi:hypothetical protein AUC69_00380 [Methyloceanibacter superfactus]|jgi:hypothetical protein|uniref:Uncharacterized protein n=1 Tax=Methyloceanibacter superfactus TaxID=1774969 RepID=A0A1E3W886_9HYPH|nr:hypothetical protein [Methyloceanibacter superfactus]ODS01991.1 hypothetical protein AUC69_00380 [Methyloceanibacter superfactus]